MTDQSKYRILLVEDDENLGYVISDLLKMDGYEVSWAKDGQVGFEQYCSFNPHLSVLDIMLPIKDGYTLGGELKARNPQSPIIFLTARTMETDRVKGFQIGADDYITKPFSNQEFLLRIKAILKRCYSNEATGLKNEFVLGDYVFSPSDLLLSNGDSEKQLTQKEADVLKLLCQYVNKTVKRELILSTAWGNIDYFAGRSLDVFISKLRKYLKADNRINIENVHGVGFRLKVES
ncbi:MAG: response regulator transcription factor [Flavobacteriales bacterium]|nr:response regulator transcription factor [Flavobacteriales bacterium]